VEEPRIEVGPPKVFTTAGVLLINAYGLLLVIPLVIAIVAISLLRFGLWTWLLPVLVVVATVYLLPFALGNSRVVRLVGSPNTAASQAEDRFVVQLTCWPRIRTGFRALLEDADDIGCLNLTGSELVFRGDSVKLTIPFDRIEEVRPQNVGFRGLFVYGSRIMLVVSGLPEIKSVEFAERSSRLLHTSRKTTRKLYERLAAKVDAR
jgi:hypothetical protein